MSEKDVPTLIGDVIVRGFASFVDSILGDAQSGLENATNRVKKSRVEVKVIKEKTHGQGRKENREEIGVQEAEIEEEHGKKTRG